LEKAIEIKRRAQRCIQNGDLDGALAEYEKLVGFEDSDPYNFVLLADLLFKKGDQARSAERYLAAVTAYEKSALYKNAIAVCKKMTRLSLTPAKVLNALAHLHALDGLAGEASLYYVQYAEHMVRSSAPADAALALRKAFDVCQDNIKVLEQLAEAWILAGDQHQAAKAMLEAATNYRERGQTADANRCQKRASALDASVSEAPSEGAAGTASASQTTRMERGVTAAPSDPPATDLNLVESARDADDPAPAKEFEIEPTSRATVVMKRPALKTERGVDGFDSGRHETADNAEEKQASAAGASPGDFAATEAEIEAFGAADAAADADDDAVQFVIDEDSLEGEPVESTNGHGKADDPADEPVYEIEVEDTEPEPVAQPEPVAAPVSTAAPGLAFGSPVGNAEAQPARAPVEQAAYAPTSGPTTQELGLQQVEALLTQAQAQFRAGDRERASTTLARAAQAYEVLGRFDSAATIYRSLGRSASVPASVMELWLINCERRGDKKEASTVACEMGDRALNGGDESDAKRWFERAVGFDAQNETARRRLQRLGSPGGAASGPVAVASATPGAPPIEAGRVEVAVGRGEAVTFDLSGLLSEFQRGVEAQLAGDPQSHYDLGMTYREMGLLEQAVDSFRVAVGEPRLAARALEMIGRCHADQSRWAEAVGEFRRALQQPTPDGGDAELRFHYAHALVELGEAETALTEYERVASQLPGHEDVDDRIAALRRVLGRG
jgi:tetratricopeptide (TPR) repeat protein